MDNKFKELIKIYSIDNYDPAVGGSYSVLTCKKNDGGITQLRCAHLLDNDFIGRVIYGVIIGGNRTGLPHSYLRLIFDISYGNAMDIFMFRRGARV